MRNQVFCRSWALEATWHPQRLQGHGVLYALLPLLGAGTDPRATLRRHAGPFGCNLWTAPVLLGAMARLEEEGRGDEAAALRDHLAGPLSGVGDVHVWTGMRPAGLLLALGGVLAGHPWLGLAAGLLLYDAALLAARQRGFTRGWQLGAELERAFAAVRPAPRLGHAAHVGLAAAAGALAVWGTARGGPGAFLMPGALVLGYYAARRQWSPGVVFWFLVVLVSLSRRFSNPVGLP